MKRAIIGSIVGGIIFFAWQFVSWPMLNLHKAAVRYTSNQAIILGALTANLPEEGGYMVPGLPETATSADHEQLMKEAQGKPWATIQYHKSNEAATTGAMVWNMIHSLIVNMITVFLFCWIISRISDASFRIIFLASLFTGFIVFFNSAYTVSIWYQWFDIMAYFTDAMVSWALCGLWLGWWFNRK